MEKSIGKVIKKSIMSVYPGAVLYGLVFNVSLMIDSIIAGQSLGADGIMAVALGMPGYGVVAAVVYSLVHGSGLRMIWAKGRTDDEGYHRAFCGGATLVGITGFIIAVLIIVFADNIVVLSGGDMVEAPVQHNAVLYLSFCAPIVFLTALGMILQEVLNVMGFQKARASLGIINTCVNIIVSVLCVSYFPADMKLAGLGIGTSAGGIAEFICGIIIFRSMKVRVGYRPLLLSPGEILDTLRSGFPSAADYFAESIVMGMQNNLILNAFPGNALILPTAEVVCNISYFASGTIKGAAIALEPLFGVFYVEQDVRSIKKVWKQGWGFGIVMSVVWALLFYLSLPLLSSLCGMELSQDISRGVFLSLLFAPAMHTVYVFTLYYEGIKRFDLSMAFAIIPDSCLYILMMMFLIPILGKDGIWLAITGNQVVGLVLLIPLVLLIGAKSGRKQNRLLLLPEDFYTGTILLEFEIMDAGAKAMTELDRLREPLKRIFSNSDKEDKVMYCVREYVSRISPESKGIHIVLRENNNNVKLFVRSLGDQQSLPASIEDNTKSWGEGDSVTYSYVYKMNIVCITLKK